jgi:hypothetical protein
MANVRMIVMSTLLSVLVTMPCNAAGVSWDTSVGQPGFNDYILELCGHAGDLYAVGNFTAVGDSACSRVARFDGAAWSPLTTGADGLVRCACSWNGWLVIGGAFSSAGGVPGTHYLSAWDGNSWLSLNGDLDGEVQSLAVHDGRLIVGGAFTHTASSEVDGIAAWDGSTWSPIGMGFQQPGQPAVSVRSLTTFNSELIAGGCFSVSGTTAVNRVARCAGSSWQPLGSGLAPDSSTVCALHEFGTDLIAGGDFSSVGSFLSQGIARWDGVAWQTFEPAVIALPDTGVESMESFLGKLYVGGGFAGVTGVPNTAHLAIWDGDEWRGLQDEADSTITSLLVWGGDLYAAGHFTTIGGTAANRIARICPHVGPIWHVSPEGDDVLGDGSSEAPFRTIQRAVTAATAGDRISLADGIYSGAGNVEVQLGDKELTICSESGSAADCIIDCEGQDGFLFASVEPGTTAGPGFENITIQYADVAIEANGLDVFSYGESYVNVLIDHCRILDCRKGVVSTWGFLDIGNCDILGNGEDSMGIELTGFGCTATLDSCAIRDHHTGVSFDTNGAKFSPGVRGKTGSWPFEARQTDFVENDTGFFGAYLEYPGCLFHDCRFDSNGVGFWAYSRGAGVTIEACSIQMNTSDGASLSGFGGFHIDGGTQIRYNKGDGIKLNDVDDLVLDDVVIYGNQQWGVGHEALPQDYGSASFALCHVDSNLGGGLEVWAESVVITDCLISRNTGCGLTVTTTTLASSSLEIARTTVVANESSGLVADHAYIGLSQVIIADNIGAAVSLPQESVIDVNCSDLHGNGGGDWVDPINDLLGQSGNISVDPGFCDPGAGDYHLEDISPCASAKNWQGGGCGILGALSVECFVHPEIESVADVPNDQGLQVRLLWSASHYDAPGAPEPIMGYGIYRWNGVTNRTATRETDGRIIGWDYLTTVPARGDDGYQYVAPTLCDSVGADPCLSTFFVSAMTADPYVYYDSEAASGYSVDNLVPPPPGSFTVGYGVQNALSWLPSDAPDIAFYTVYRGTTEVFEPGEATLLTRTEATALVDEEGSWWAHYMVSTEDDGGNESEAVPASLTTGVREQMPTRTRLVAGYPNPFNPSTRIAYALASQQSVSLCIYDLRGRVVRRLVPETVQPAGRHEIEWLGRDEHGRGVAAGTYICRLVTSEATDAIKLLLAR